MPSIVELSKSDPSWLLHTSGYLRTQQDLCPQQKVDLKAIEHALLDEISPEDCYKTFAEMGLHYGPAFQGIERLWRKDGEALGQVRLGEHLALEGDKYCFHPAFLDPCFQVLFGAIPQENGAAHKGLYLPVQIERVRFYRSPGHRVWSHVQLTHISANALAGDIRVYDEDGSPLMEFEGFRCQAIKGVRGDDADEVENWFYEVKWHHKPRPEQQVLQRSADFIPASREIAQAVVRDVRQLDDAVGWSTMISKAEGSVHGLVQRIHPAGTSRPRLAMQARRPHHA